MSTTAQTAKRDTTAAARRASAAAGKPSAIASMPRAKRAAIVIAMMGEDAAKPIVDKLDNASMAKVTEALEEIAFLPKDQLVEIVVDFLSHLRHASGAFRGGKSKAREVIEGMLDTKRLNQLFGDEPEEEEEEIIDESGDSVWQRLARREPKPIADYVAKLTPNIAALILKRLDVSQTSDILCHLEEDMLRSTMKFMIDGEAPDPGIYAVVERMVEMEFLNNATVVVDEDNAHLESVGELLSLVPREKRDFLVDFLKTEHEEELKSIEKGLFTIDGIPEILPRVAVPVVFRELGNPLMVKVLASLQGGGEAVSEHLLNSISSRMADQIKDELQDAGTLSEGDIELVQREFLSGLMGLKRKGLITIERPPEPAQS